MMKSKDDFDVFCVEVREITTSRFLPDIIEEISAIFASHGARLEMLSDRCAIHLPKETRKSEIFPRIHFSRYRVFLPDGFEFYETECVAADGVDAYSSIRMDLSLFSPEIQKKYNAEIQKNYES